MASAIHPSSSEDAAVTRFIHAAQSICRPRSADFHMKVGIGTRELLVKVGHGAVECIDDMAALRPLTPWDFSVTAEADSWQRFWNVVPDAGWHDIFALMRFGRMRVEGNLHPFMAHLQFVKDLLAAPRSKDQA